MDINTLHRILDLARWAPSGDNTQPWRFVIPAASAAWQVEVHGFDTREHVLYDFHGHPSHLAHGALLETMRIAASAHGLSMAWELADANEERAPVYRVRFIPDANLVTDPLFPFIEQRVVQRRPMRTTPLRSEQRAAIIAAAGDAFDVQLFESLPQCFGFARMIWRNAHIRLTCPEAYPVHKEIIEWGARYSDDRIPEQAVGVDPLTAKLMRWVMQSWKRVDFFNRFLLGTVVPRIQLDFLPAIFCAAHLLIRTQRPLVTLADWVNAGMVVQRVWLTVAQQGLHLQPEMTPIIFRWYARAGEPFSRLPALGQAASRLAGELERLGQSSTSDSLVFLGRIGTCRSPRSRSRRLALDRLCS